MLSDPLSVTHKGSAVSLPRVSSSDVPSLFHGTFSVADRSLRLAIHQSKTGVYSRHEVTLLSRILDVDGVYAENGFGLVYYADLASRKTDTEIPALRTTLLSLVDATLQGRIIGGEN